MTKTTTITCDTCGKPVVHGLSVSEIHREAYATWEGRTTTWEFCSSACLAQNFTPPIKGDITSPGVHDAGEFYEDFNGNPIKGTVTVTESLRRNDP